MKQSYLYMKGVDRMEYVNGIPSFQSVEEMNPYIDDMKEDDLFILRGETRVFLFSTRTEHGVSVSSCSPGAPSFRGSPEEKEFFGILYGVYLRNKNKQG